MIDDRTEGTARVVASMTLGKGIKKSEHRAGRSVAKQ